MPVPRSAADLPRRTTALLYVLAIYRVDTLFCLGYTPSTLRPANINGLLFLQSDLTYACVCADGKTADVADYKDTLPFHVCIENFGQCIANNARDSEAQDKCKEDRKKCGSKDPENAAVDDDDDDEDDSSSASSTGTSAPTSTDDASSTADSTPSPTDNAAVAQTYSMGVLAAAFVGAFGFLA